MKVTRAALTVALVFGLLAAPLAPEAQQAGRGYRIGLLDCPPAAHDRPGRIDPLLHDPARIDARVPVRGLYAGIRAGNQLFHLKLAEEKDPSIEFVETGEHFHLYFETDDARAAAEMLKRHEVRLVKDVHETPWGTREFVIKDDQGHTLYFGERVTS